MKSKYRPFGLYRCVGGKRRVAGNIVDRILERCGGNPPIGYCEPFVGSGSVCLSLLGSFEGIQRVWLNDVDRGCFALWWCVLNEPDELLRLVHQFEPSRELFFAFKRDFLEGREFSLVELALRKLAVQQMSFSGMGVMAGGPLRKIGSRWSPRCIERNVREARRLFAGREVRITNWDYKRVLREVDADTLVFADPPYVSAGEDLYQHSFALSDHLELRSFLAAAKFPWLVTYDDCSLVRDMYGSERIVEMPMKYSDSGRRSRNPEKRELLITACPQVSGCLAELGQLVEWPGSLNGPRDERAWPRLGDVCDVIRSGGV